MTPRSLRLLGRKITAAALAAALALSGSGPIYAQEIRAVSGRASSPGVIGNVGALALPNVLAPLSPSALNASLTPSMGGFAAPSLKPSLSPSAAALGGHPRALPVLASPSLRPADALPAPVAAASAGPLAALKAFVSGAPSAPSVPAGAPGLAKTPAKPGDASALPAEATSGDAKEFADAAFRRLHGEAGASVSGAAPAVVAAPEKKSWKRRLGLAAASLAAGGTLAVSNSGSHAAGAMPPIETTSLPSLSVVGQYLGQAGYWIGNALAFVFPIPEVYKAISGGKVAVPAWRAGILVTASLALGLVNATVAGMPLWGIQNIFAATVMLLAWPAARWGKKAAVGDPAGLGKKKTMIATAVTVVAALAASAAIFYAASAVVPAALALAFGAASIGGITLGIMAATGGAFFLLFLPDVISIVRGKAPNGFTPGFSLMFLLASLGFVVWTGHLAWIAEAGSPQRAQFGLYAALNAAYVLVSGASWWVGRKAAKAVTIAPKADVAPAAAPLVEAGPSRAPPSRFASLAEAESRAHSSARARAGNVRLLRVGVDLKKAGPRWVFAFHAPAAKQILTYGPDGVSARKFGGDERPAMLYPEELPTVDLAGRVAALAEKEPGFSPVRAEIVALGKGGLKVYGYDSRNNSREMPLPTPVVEAKEDAVPPAAEQPAVPAGPQSPPSADRPAAREEAQSTEPTPVQEEATSSSPSATDDLKLPNSWKRFPAEASEATSEAMLAAKADAQERARALAPDARLVSVAINLEDPRSHWIFIFRSDKRNEELTVWTKRVAVRKLGFRPTKAPTLWDTRLGAVGPLDRAYAALKKANPRFRPVRVEVDPAWTGAASYRFLDAFGRAAFVGADGKPVFDAPALPVAADAKPPKSFENLPEDARGADGKSLLVLKAEAQARARALASDARLVRVAINLDDPRSHWIFVFRSDSRREELTVWTKRIEARRLRPGTRRIPTLNDARLEKAAPVAAAYAALKAAKPGLKPVRLELIPTWKGDAGWSFKDARGRGTAVASVAKPAAPLPKPEIPDERGPPETTKPEPPDTTQPAPPETPAPEIPAPKPPETSFPGPRVPPKHIYEDFLGFRTVKGVRHDPALKPLLKIESIDQVIDQISRQFNIPRARVIELGVKYRLNEFSPLKSWIGVYDRLQAANRDQFKRLDSKKYSGWKSFRELANKTYAPGWKGALARALEFHKHFIGAAIRFPYHLFDMFLFGYFRQAISFEFRRSGEDFMALSERDNFAEQWLESSMRTDAFNGAGALAGLKAKSWYRAANRWFIVPLAAPLTTFLARRVTLAVMSAIAMGLLGAFAPILPLSFALTSIPLLGPGIVAVLNGLPVAVAAVPFIGDVMAPVVAAAVTALAKDLILGPLLNTLILSTLLTFPAAARERVAKLRDEAPLASLPVRGLIVAVLGAAVSWEFWKANLKSFFGLVTVGAEIEGIMTYATSIDGFIDPGIKAVTGRELHLFHSIGAAVERPEGDSPIPFGGAITWGNTLLYKLQILAGFNISDAVMNATITVKSALTGGSATDLPMAALSAQALISASTQRPAEPGKAPEGAPFDPDLWKLPMDQVMARIKTLAGQAGHLDAEIAAVKEHRGQLMAELGDKQARLAQLQKQSRPVTDAERAEYERLLAELAVKSDEVGAREKLSERRDLLHPPSDKDALARLEALRKEFAPVTPPPPPDGRNGYWEDLAAQDASMKALSQRLEGYVEGRAPPAPGGPASTLPVQTQNDIAKLVGEIEALRATAQGEVAQRDATSQLLASSNRVRNAALRERRSGADMLRFHTDMAKLASVMDLALSLNEINAAQTAIKQMMDLLEAKRAKIAASRAGNQQNQAGADQNAGMTDEWREEINRDIASDDKSLKDLADSEAKAGMVAATLGSFQTDMRAFIDGVNAQDRGASADAATEYQRRIDLLPMVKAWRTTGGNPNDPDAFSMKKFNENLAEINDNLAKAQDGLARIGTMPLEYAGVLVIEVPGPAVSVSNPTPEQTRQILADRKGYWQGKRADFGGSLDTVNRMLDAGNGRTVIDEFGDAHPESLPQWKAQSQAEITNTRAALSGYLARLDANAANINRVAGSNIPMLSGLGLVALQDAIKTYGDSLKAVNFPDGDTLAGHAAMMDLVASAKLVPRAAREVIRWSKADATVTAIDDATQNVLPKARTGLQGVVTMLDSVLSDVDADLAFVNSGTGGGQALIDRKTALLRDKIVPALQGAKSMLVDTLIPYQQKSIDQVSAADSDYFRLYDSQKTVITQAVKLYDHTLPWAFATFGAADGNQAEAAQKIGEWRHKLQKNLDGYDEAGEHHKGIHEFQVEMANRKDPNYTGTEVTYGETSPYSLPRKIAQYTAERSQRADQINAQDAQINEIIGKIETISKGKYSMSQFRLPVGVTADAAGVARVQAAVDADAIPKLVDRLKAVADEAQAGAASIDLGGSGGDGTVPSGPQPAITVSDNQQISLLALEAAKRLVPTSLNQPETAPAAYAIARLLYSDTVIGAANDGLNVQVPAAERFLGRVSTVLGDAISEIPKDEAYAASNGTSETADQVFARKIRTFSSIDAVLLEGMDFFRLKQTWNRDKFGTIDSVQNYYDSLHDIYSGGQTANDNEVEALDTMQAALRKTMTDLEDKRVKISSWLGQLNPKEKSALNNVSEDISKIMDKTRSVLEANIDWHRLQDQLGRSREIIQAQFVQIEDKQADLAKLLAENDVQGQLEPGLVRRIEALRMNRSGWASDGSKADPASLVIRKSEYGAFVDTLLGMVTQGAQSSSAEVSAIRADLLRNPQGLASLIPNSKVLEFGDNADGFYLVYQSKFAVPHGLDTSSWVTLGNIGKVFGSNVSVSGYQLASPPSKDGENAPYGDKGVEVQVESLQGKNWVNYLNVDLHRFAFDIPDDNTVKTGAGESRMMVFNDFAMMMFGDRLYVGLAGFGDAAVSDAKDKPYYYGGNLKSSLKLTEVMKLNFEQRALFAQDPRKFLQDVNLDFTGYDPDLNRNFRIEANGEKKNYFRTQVGPQLDLNRLMNPEGGGDTFTVDLYWAKTSGTDDVNQQLGGVSILKGFSLKNDEGKTWMRIDNRLTGEMGQKQNEIGDRLSVSFPDQGLVVSAEGKIIGGASTYFGEISKKMGDHANIALSYGSQYVGMNNRLTISMNTSFTFAELWQHVSDNSAQNLRGGETLKGYNRELGEFFSGDEAKSSRTAMDLQKVFEVDVARKLVTQDIGNLSREIQELRKAGDFMENSRVRGMVGYVSGSVSNDLAERAVGGGFTVGTYTEMTLNKTQKQLLQTKAQVLYREGLRLQDRMLSLTQDWQASVVEIAEAQWALKLANFSVQNAPSETSRREAAVRLADAESRLHQAVLSYNSLTGRDPQSAPPFQDLNSGDLRRMLGNIRSLITSPDRLGVILRSLDEESLKKSVGEDPFNVVDWIPWVDRLTVGFGVQFQDMMANQALTLGGSVRLPLYDPAAKGADKAYRLESQAAIEEMKQAYAERTLAGQAAAEESRIWEASALAVEPNAPAAAQALSDAIRAYRNGLIEPEKLRAAFAAWDWYNSTTLHSLARADLLRAQAGVTAPFRRPTDNAGGPIRLTSLDDAFAAASAGSHSLGEIAKRQEAASEMARAADHRIQKAWLDINVGVGLTAQGVGWLPSLGITGIPVTPVLGFELKPEEMRELQVTQHTQQAEYYAALKGRVEAGLAVQFYQNMVALRSAESRVAVYDGDLLPRLRSEAASGDVAAVQRYDAAKIARQTAFLEVAKSRATINFLLGRPAEAPVEAAIDERQALEALSRLLAAKDPVGAQRRILDARVSTAKAVEELVDKNLKVELLQLEPVSLVVRSLGRLMGALTDSPVYNEELAAAARIQTLTEERERDAYDGRRDAEVSRLGLQLNAARAALENLGADGRPEAMLEKSRLASSIFSLQAGLLALGVDPASELAAKQGTLPGSWADLTRRLAASEQSLTTVAPDGKLDLITPENLKHRSAAFVRYYYAKQTLGHVPIGQSFNEGWIELRLTDPGTPPEVLMKLASLRTEKADRLYRDALVGAASRSDILAAQFEGDARLLRYLETQIRGQDAAQPPAQLAEARASLRARLESQKQGLVARMGLPVETKLDDLLRLVPEDADPAATLGELSSRLITEIRLRQVDSIRRTLFDGGTPASWGKEDDIMQQIKANTIAERMTYKGFTPVATFGYFRGTPISGAFIEAPDPRQIELGLEKVMGEVLRKEMQATGRLQTLTLRLHSLMVSVEDGARGLEARRKLIESAENDLRIQGEKSGTASAEYVAARKALVSAWDGFAQAMTSTKADFTTLVTELVALGEGSAGSLRPLATPDHPEAAVSRSDPKSQLLDYWAGRYADPFFEAGQDELFAKMGTAVTPAMRARIATSAASYRVALADADAVRTNPFSEAETLDLLIKIDVEGKRVNLRSELETALRGVGLLDPTSNPVARDFLAYMRKDLSEASKAFALDRGQKIALDRALSEVYWRAHKPTDAEAATFARLDRLSATLEDARDDLLTSYLADSNGPTKFILTDRQLDAYLKAQGAFDAELARTLAAKPSPAVVRALDGLYDLREILDRSIAKARSGRGMAALDALIMLETSRLRAARWNRETPARIDPIADALSRLRETRERWTKGKVGTDLEPLYAVVRRDGAGKTTWSVDQWMTAETFEAMRLDGVKNPGADGAIITRLDPATGKTGYFIDKPKGGGTGKFVVIGGADAADAAREAADTKFTDNRGLASLQARMAKNDFVALGEPLKEALGWDFAEVFGPGGMHSLGRVFFFELRTDGKPAKALHPLDALARSPETVVMKLYLGDKALARDRFPTLRSLEASEEGAAFKTLTISPKGAEALIKNARDLEASERRRGWIEVKLNSFGFARDANGKVSQLYRTKDDFDAQWKAFENAEKDLKAAERDLAAAAAEEAARTEEAASAKAAVDGQSLTYQVAQLRLREALRKAMLASGLDERAPAFAAELNRRVAEPKLGKLPAPKDDALRGEIERAHEAYASEIKLMDAAAKVFTEASSKLKLAQARAVNAGKALKDAKVTLARGGEEGKTGTWTLHRTSGLSLGLDSTGKVVHVAAKADRGPSALDAAVTDGGPEAGRAPVSRTVSGVLLAAVVDKDGQLVRAYSGDQAVDEAFKSWSLISYRAGEDVVGADGDEAMTKVRYSHYEETVGGRKLPVLLAESYLIDRLDGAQSALWKAKHWSYLPFNWGNILLEIPRGIAGIPAEFAGRDPRQNHYLGRAYMYKTEGGATEHHGFFRSVLGGVDVLNLLPDPVDRYFDPSQFPDKVRIDSALRPGEGLWNKDLEVNRGDEIRQTRDDRKDPVLAKKNMNIHLGRQALQREVTHAAEDLNASRVRTLSRFNGGVEELTLETRRGRAGMYQESTLTAQLGPDAVRERLKDGSIGTDPRSDGRGEEGREGDVVTSATPGHLFVDSVERRVRIRPGADAYGLQAEKLVARSNEDAAADLARTNAAGAGLELTLAEATKLVDAALADRDQARGELESVRERWNRLAQRIGEQLELEKRIAALQAEIKGLEDRIAFWDRYLRLLDEARRGPADPNQPKPPYGPNPMFWVWMLALSFLGALASALWHWLRRSSPPPNPAV